MYARRHVLSAARAVLAALVATLLFGVFASPALAKTPSLKTLAKQVTTLQKQVKALQKQYAALAAQPVLSLSPYVSVDKNAENGVAGPNVVFHGANVHVVSGSGSENDGGGTLTGLGNLIVGYDATATGFARDGSHNLVVGNHNGFSSYGEFVAGDYNRCSALYASVGGGYGNTASGDYASVGGGYGNTASGDYASVGGGGSNTASGGSASVSGGFDSTASSYYASVSGGRSNIASGYYASVGGGDSLTESVQYGWSAGSIGGNAYAGRFTSH